MFLLFLPLCQAKSHLHRAFFCESPYQQYLRILSGTEWFSVQQTQGIFGFGIFSNIACIRYSFFTSFCYRKIVRAHYWFLVGWKQIIKKATTNNIILWSYVWSFINQTTTAESWCVATGCVEYEIVSVIVIFLSNQKISKLTAITYYQNYIRSEASSVRVQAYRCDWSHNS